MSPLTRDVAALVEVVEALEDYDGPLEHTWRCEYRTAAKGWKPGEPPVIECVCGLDRLRAALDAVEPRREFRLGPSPELRAMWDADRG